MSRIFWKILLTFWLTLLVAGVIAGGSVWFHQRAMNSLEKDLVVRPSSILAIKAAANTFLFSGADALRNMLLELQQEAPDSLKVYAVDANGHELLDRVVSSEMLQRVRRVASQNFEPPIVRSVESRGQSYVLFSPRSAQFSNKGDDRGSPPPPFSGLILIVSGIVVSLISSVLLAWYFSRPVHLLSSAFRDLASGDLAKRVAPEIGDRRDEIADLGKDFDFMAEKLQRLVSSQRRLLHDVSHELRSPLARIQVSIGLARQQPERTADSMERIELEVVRLDKLVGELLTLSRLESSASQGLDEYLDILELLNAVIEDARFESQTMGRKVHFDYNGEENLIVLGYGELLFRAIENVVRNAIHHTPAESTVTLSLFVLNEQSTLQVIVDDEGSGVEKTELINIFEPFQRSDSSDSTFKGFGLGLAIAKRTIESHHGTIHAINRPKGGLRIIINLPFTRNSSDQNGGEG